MRVQWIENWLRGVLAYSFVAALVLADAGAEEGFRIGEKTFLLEGRPFVVRGGELHYARIPREHWQHRLSMARAMGLNTVSTYLFWNLHEPKQGEFAFGGNSDIAEFCRLAQKEGLKVIIRPGPYVCAEWDFGGLPWWLLKERDLKVRTRDPRFLKACREYFLAVGEQLAPLQITKGGPIIMVQVENEYDGYGADQGYMAALKGYLYEAGFEVPFFTSEMGWSMRRSADTDLLRTVGVFREPQKAMESLRLIQPTGPLMSGEYYTGWFDVWGRGRGSGTEFTKGLAGVAWMLENGVSFNLYMAHGGTTFGFNSGANYPPYKANPTSYDYGAPISEAGWPTEKYYALRELLAKHLAPDEELPPIPERNSVIQVAPFELNEMAPLLANLPEPKKVTRPLPMEMFDQAHGCILYRTKLPAGGGERLVIRDLHDYALVFLDGEQIATLERGRKQNSVALPVRKEDGVLDILVEGLGRVNFGDYMHDRKGITERVELMQGRRPRELTGWEVFNLPLDQAHLAGLKFGSGRTNVPAFYRGKFNLREAGDTFLDMSLWGKGVVWVNGHNLGRYWNIGPQQTLYCPGPWLKRGDNEIVVLDLNGPEMPVILGRTEPVLDRLNYAGAGRIHRKRGQTLRLEGETPVHSGRFAPGTSWQSVTFEEPVSGRYFCLEALNSQAEDVYTTCAELELVGKEGKVLSRAGWRILYADSEEMRAEDGSADNILDGRSDTFWHTGWEGEKPEHPHQLVIDLGKEEVLTGLRYQPRQDLPHGHIGEYRVYVSGTLFPGL